MGIKNIFPAEKIRQFESLLGRSERIVVTCHVSPDGDAVGSSLGWYHLLKSRGKDVTVVVPDRIPRSLTFLPGSNEIAIFTQHEAYSRRLLAEADLVLMCDFNEEKRQDNLGPVVTASPAAKVLMDHHKFPDIQCDIMFSYPEMSSTCELVFRIMAALGMYSDMNKDAATCILTGLITDTQNFTVNCNDYEVYEVMIKLLEKGVDKEQIVNEAIKSITYNALKLNSFALYNRLEMFNQHKCALITLSTEDLKKFDYQKGDTEGLVNQPLRIIGVAYSVFMREDENYIKVSMRSRNNFPVDKICREHFNGGGHTMAAGGEFKGTLAECRQTLIDVMPQYDIYLTKNQSVE